MHAGRCFEAGGATIHINVVRPLSCDAFPSFRIMSETPTTTTFQKSIAIRLQFVLQYASNLYRSAFGAPSLRGKGNTVSTPPICIAVRLPFVLQYASHWYRSTFGKILVVVVTGMFPIPCLATPCHSLGGSGNGHRTDQSKSLRPPKVAFQTALYSALPPKSHDTFCLPFIVSQNQKRT